MAMLSVRDQIVQERWSVRKVEDLIKQLGIRRCDIAYQSKAVRLHDPSQLYDILTKVVTSELSSGSRANISRYNGKLRLDIGGWRFEALEN